MQYRSSKNIGSNLYLLLVRPLGLYKKQAVVQPS